MRSLVVPPLTIFLLLATCVIRQVPLDGEETNVVDTPRPPRLSFEVEEALAPGLLGRFRQADRQDTRHFRLAAIHVNANEVATPWLDPEPFQLTLEGYLYLELSGRYTLKAPCQGDVTLKLNGTSVIAAETPPEEEVHVRLHQGYNRLSIQYGSPEQGDAQLRVLWRSKDFPWESLPTTALYHDVHDQELQVMTRLRLGRHLFAALSCAKCHTTPVSPGAAMPELERENPRLTRVTKRLNPDWLVLWIAQPDAMRNHISMPRVLPGQLMSRREQAADIVAFLRSTAGTSEAVETQNRSSRHLIDDGEVLFENLGCIGCHHFAEPDHEDDFQRTSLRFIAAKFLPGQLIEFLGDPRAHYPWSRMPDLRIETKEAERLAAYLQDASQGKVTTATELANADVDRGRRIYRSQGCVNCHPLPGLEPQLRPAASLPGRPGCLAPAEKLGSAPQYDWDDDDREALIAFVQSDQQSLQRSVAVEAAERFIQRLRCTVCHRRDQDGGLWADTLLEEGSRGIAPELLPPLTWVGEKLHTDWMHTQFLGQLPYKPRGWLKARMPGFPRRAAWLASGMVASHGYSRRGPQGPALDPALAKIGGELVQQNTGFFCIECHAVGPKQAIGAFSHHGVNFAYVADRLHYDYYRRWITNPTRVDPSSKMPRFSTDGVTTAKTAFFAGDAQRQFDALWHYLLSVGAHQN